MRLDRLDTNQLHRTWTEAFADYVVDMTGMTERRIRLRAVKSNVDFGVSVGAYEGNRMVGFTLIGVDHWQGGIAAFDAGTGIVPEARGRGLAAAMLEHALPALKRRGVTRFLLEVIQTNQPAIRAYTKAGFEIVRSLSCFMLDVKQLRRGGSTPIGIEVRPADRATVLALADHAAWQPSWETSFRALERIPEELMVLAAFSDGGCVGAVAYSAELGWVMTVVVHRDHRRRGIGSLLMERLVANLPDGVAQIKLVNVDGSASGMMAFLESLGFSRWVDQYEMARPV